MKIRTVLKFTRNLCCTKMMSWTGHRQKHHKPTRRLIVNDHDCEVFSHDIVYNALEPKNADILEKLTRFRAIPSLDEFILNGLLQKQISNSPLAEEVNYVT